MTDSLLFQIPVQLAAMGALTFVVYRDATRRRRRFGAAPGGISPETWAGVCGLLWVPVIAYLFQRRRQAGVGTQVGARPKHLWWAAGLAVAVAWLVSDIAAGRTSSVVEHGAYLGLVLAGWGWAAVADRRGQGEKVKRHELADVEPSLIEVSASGVADEAPGPAAAPGRRGSSGPTDT